MSKKLKETSDRVWLAGLGALAVAEQEGSDLFQQLVKKGRESQYDYDRRALVKALLAAWQIPLSPESRSKILGAQPLLRFLPSAQEKETIEARQSRRLSTARRSFLKEFGSLDKSSVDYERLQQERKIFTVTHRGTTYVPSFQFDEKGRPRPAVARVIQILGKDTPDWDLALWFTAASGYLDGRRPVDLLSSHPEVIQAAEQEAAELVF